MPIYEYKCRTCGKEFELMQRITEKSLEHCPEEICENLECKGQGEVFRKISKNIGLVFNGSGFYLTDYKNKNTSNGTNGTHKKNGDNEKSSESSVKETSSSETNSKTTEDKKTTTTQKAETVSN